MEMSNKRYLGNFRAMKRHSIIRHRDVSLLNQMKLGAMTLNLLQLKMAVNYFAIGINQPYVESEFRIVTNKLLLLVEYFRIKFRLL